MRMILIILWWVTWLLLSDRKEPDLVQMDGWGLSLMIVVILVAVGGLIRSVLK